MIQICRAEDGHVSQVNASFRDIERAGSLELFLHQQTGVDEEAIIAYLSDGRRLRNDSIRELAGAQDQSIFVFNKYYLDFDLQEVLHELRVEPPLQPPIEDTIAATPPFRPSQLATYYLRTAHSHNDYITHTLSTLPFQHEAIRIALSSLELNVLAIADAFEGIAGGARGELEKQASLLAGLQADLEIINRVKIHVEFMSPAVRHSIEAGGEPRTLGDYVSNVKMKQVADTCTRTHDELRESFLETEGAVSQLKEGTDIIRAMVSDVHLLDEAESCMRRCQDTFDKINDTVAILEGPASDSEATLNDIKQLDTNLRNDVIFITDIKNAYTEQCLGALRRVSVLNNDLIKFPPALSDLQARLRGKNSFSHIQRLHNMLYAYGATVIEIVRRKEFARFFYQRAQSILEVMAKLSASERKRRQVYRGEVHGQLPFDAKGMDNPVPIIDFSPAGSTDSPYTLERADVEGLFRVLDDLEQFARSSSDHAALGAVKESRGGLEKLVHRMDSLESGFDRIAERSLLSASRLSASRRRLTEADEQAFQELTEQLRDTQESKAHQENLFLEERSGLQAEIQRLKSKIENADDSLASEQDRANQLERDLHLARTQVESETTARRIIEERHTQLLSDIDGQRQALSVALHNTTEQTKTAEVLRQELATFRAQFDEVKALENRNAQTAARLLEDQARTLRNLEEARARGEDLEIQIQVARKESDEMNNALKEAVQEKDRLLRLQASEHDRLLRDHIAEADGDRAVLEHQFSELKAVLQDTDRQLKDARAQVEITDADAVGLREELQRVEHEVNEARQIERVLRDDLKAGRASQSNFEHRLENSGRLIAQILDVAIAFRASHVKALGIAQIMSTHPSSASKQSQSQNLVDSLFASSGIRHSPNTIGQIDEPSPIDPSDPTAALEILRAFDHDHFLETINKTGSTIRKWQKQCKEYRERAKGKISFRNFAKGDLALFLPTRNSISKPWAAFNVSFPHYFLQATGHLAEQLKTREWIVARITSITERVVDQNDPGSNPYGLGDGVKYYMLEVEDWTQPSQPNKRRISSRRASASADKELKEPAPSTTPSIPPEPPQAEVEDSFRVNRPPHLFDPVRTRTNSSPTAGPSSLSRLLAQAPAENGLETILTSRSRTPSPTTSPPPPPSPSIHTGSVPRTHVPGMPSPMRPGSRASRMSSSSRFSAGRKPPFANSVSSGLPSVAKASATIALSEQTILPSPTSSGSGSPSPEGSITEDMSNILHHRRRTTSHHVPRASPLAAAPTETGTSASGALASLASSWGVSFGRKKNPDGVNSSIVTTPTMDPTSTASAKARADRGTESSASDLLKRL